jgi:DNA repair exonuclease SbcCD ATPase subunit
LLRYFERKSAHEMAGILGISDEAAQKRVTRAVERLREFFAKRGVAVGAGIYEARQASQLREQVQTLQRQQASYGDEIQRLQRERDEAANRLSALAGERERVEGDSGELLKLRAEATRLREEVDAAAVELKEAKEFRAAVMELYSNTPPIRTFVSTALVTASWDQTILTGGWKLPSGRRAIVLVALQPGESQQQLTIKSTLLEYTDDAGNALGLAQFNTDGQTTTKAQKLDSAQAEAIMRAAKDSEEIKIVSSPIITTVGGQQAEIQVVEQRQTPSGEGYSTGIVMDFIPTIAADGQSVQMVIAAHLNYPIQLPESQTH